jgi:UDPglucose--hexose-1-phosphate uridylyltransferase
MSGELRYDPMTGQWVNIVGHRQHRPNLPTDGCPFCPGGLEAPEPYDTRWFPNRWPAFEPGEPIDPAAAVGAGITRLPAVGAAEVILYSSQHEGSLGTLGVAQVRKVVDLWAERTAALLARPEIRYVLVFESRGPEVGATIHHPHGQIYGYPFVPPAPAAELDTMDQELAFELADGRRVVADDQGWVAWVPYASPYPYGLRVAPREQVGRLDQLDAPGRDGLASILTDVLGRYERLWAGQPGASEIFPYLMWFHQAPDQPTGREWLHLHLAPPQRSPGVARYIAAGEVGSGTLSNPVVPEDAADALRRA